MGEEHVRVNENFITRILHLLPVHLFLTFLSRFNLVLSSVCYFLTSWNIFVLWKGKKKAIYDISDFIFVPFLW